MASVLGTTESPRPYDTVVHDVHIWNSEYRRLSFAVLPTYRVPNIEVVAILKKKGKL